MNGQDLKHIELKYKLIRLNLDLIYDFFIRIYNTYYITVGVNTCEEVIFLYRYCQFFF